MLEWLKSIVRPFIRPPLHVPELSLSYEVLGTEYGGWPLLGHQTPSGALIYSFGVGEDISFDIAAIEHRGCVVHAFDPTPRSQAWIQNANIPGDFHFHPIGISNQDGEAEFFAPENAAHVSFSANPAPASDLALAIRAPVKRLETIMAELGTGTPDVLKLDIEGFEYPVLTDLLAGEVRPGQLCIEFHHRMYSIPNQTTIDAVDRLRAAGYRLFYVSPSGQEYGFAHDSILN